MKGAGIVVFFASVGLMIPVVGPPAFADGPDSSVPKANGTQLKAGPSRRRQQHPIELTVRVVLKSDPKQGVAVRVLCIPLEVMQPGFVFVNAESSANGDFHATRTACPMLVRAETADGRLGGIVQITADDAKVVIPVGPTATVRGRLIEQSTGQPVVERWVHSGVKAIYPPLQFSIWGFPNSARTDAQGKFTLSGLVPRWKFDLQTWTKPPNGPPKTWKLGAVTPRYPGILDLGDIKLGAANEVRPPASPRPARQPIYKAKNDGRAELDNALKRAGKEKKRVLIEFGGNWSEWCFKLHDLLSKNAEIAPLVQKGFVLVLLDANSNRDLLESFAVPGECRGFPFLTLLDAGGNVLTKQNSDELEDGPGYDVKRVRSFLAKWAPAE